MVEAAGVEPVPAIFITGDGARLPKIGCDPPRNLLPSPSPGVPCSPLESPPVLETFWRRGPPFRPPSYRHRIFDSRSVNAFVFSASGDIALLIAVGRAAARRSGNASGERGDPLVAAARRPRIACGRRAGAAIGVSGRARSSSLAYRIARGRPRRGGTE